MKYDGPIDKNIIDELNFKKIIEEVKLQRMYDANKKLNSLNELENILYNELYEEEEREVLLRRKQKLQDLKNANRKFKI